MRQVVVTRRGGPEVLELREVATPSPGAGEVRIKVAVASVRFGDIIKREGAYPHQPRPPLVLGAEVAGTVDVVGEDVSDVPRGQRVATFCDFNGYADHLIIAADSLIPIPDAVSDAQAVSLAANYLTAHQMVRRCARRAVTLSAPPLTSAIAGETGGWVLDAPNGDELPPIYAARCVGETGAKVISIGSFALIPEWTPQMAFIDEITEGTRAVLIDLAAAGADLAVGRSYNCLNSGPGTPAVLYVRGELHQRLE